MAGEASTTGIATHKGQTSRAERSGRSVQILSTASGGSPPFLNPKEQIWAFEFDDVVDEGAVHLSLSSLRPFAMTIRIKVGGDVDDADKAVTTVPSADVNPSEDVGGSDKNVKDVEKPKGDESRLKGDDFFDGLSQLEIDDDQVVLAGLEAVGKIHVPAPNPDVVGEKSDALHTDEETEDTVSDTSLLDKRKRAPALKSPFVDFGSTDVGSTPMELMSSGSQSAGDDRDFKMVTYVKGLYALNDAFADPKISSESMLKYGTSTIDTSNPIVLKVPSGGAWEVKLTKFDDDDHLWLGEGWPEFARHHSIKCGYTLYFRYEGQSRFYVVIVNENGSEIDYPVNDSKHFDKINPDFDKLLMPLPEKGRFKACAKWGDGLGEHFVVPSIKTLMTIKEKEKEKDLSRNENLASQNPFFKSVIQKRHLYIQYDMALPKKFWRQNMNENSCHYITLHVPHDQNKIWHVRLYVRLRSTCLFRRAAFRKKDWQRFVDENHLKVGDVCIFELIDKNEMKFQVTINRANSEG
ncbi:hypothetical protein F8388_019881 [Cannabis sativa]|uniref:TF-B3 domain-containing protein n=1 Tax=Cannabis sativa TaxID=3483 RepID=A0A7J6HDJ8_CANSA|nr:hypothetical protein F8388_019881 [Cannabis sativa]KAF4392579.1 hypothetical protein G4B88_015222 [Cannabis sativa]